ncbi:phasin family protein [Undibacterium flavidum]|uniref:Phasin family protein n=1 Tax=Undibacterium flavidum TaxID=2762297 RepID=A0ABR6Y7Y1_9BURK|nr:phasin family protein [Undibacterium flavidum]MBC3872712.1 phasin family protein [Undibacterium flavidum]
MIFVSNQLTAQSTPGFEQQFAAYNNLTQSLSEEFDRATELQAQAVQTAWETWGEFCNDLSFIKDPQEFFIRSNSQAHTIAAQGQQYLHAMIALHQQIQEKFLALGQTISPMMLNSVVEVIPSTEFTPAKQANTATLKDINPVTVSVAPKTTQRKPRAIAVKVAAEKVAAVKTATVTQVAISTPTPKVRQVKSTKKNEVNPSSDVSSDTSASPSTATATAATTATAPAKKSAVVGLPSKPAAKSGFAGAAGLPDYKAKSSKATGAKKRVRQ